MFSQLCRARPWTLWEKLSVTQSANGDHRHVDDIERVNNLESSTEDIRCQLEHCTFCEYRVCCGVIDYSNEDQTVCELDVKVTENPAYGLSVKNWLEISRYEEIDKPKLNNLFETENSTKIDESIIDKNFESIVNSTSQEEYDVNSDDMNRFNISQRREELNSLKSDSKEKLDGDNQKIHDTKSAGLSWSVLKHSQTLSNTTENCDKTLLDDSPQAGMTSITKEGDLVHSCKWIKEKSYPLSVVKPIAKMGEKRSDHALKIDLNRQKPIDRGTKKKFQNHAATDDCSERFNKAIDPLSEISQIKTEESIQEWLARINISGNNSTIEESKDKNLRGSAWDLRNDETRELKLPHNKNNEVTEEASKSQNDTTSNEENFNFAAFYTGILEEDIVADTTTVLCNASKIAPANIPIVVMQCSRLHSHIGNKPPFQRTSLPMGTLVTALYQESEWLYVQTPHGIEGFLCAANCAPIGTINEPAPMSKRPWEPCDFPIRINKHKKEEFERQQTAYIQTKLPIGNKQSIPYISTVKMKTNFYTDRYFNNTFKSKDLIKIAKTVTDILRSSPETKISH